MASSALRQRLAAGEDCAEELPEAVRAVIRREHLYQT
jgi:nicotinic acid mononucleotide adenylyltransferase